MSGWQNPLHLLSLFVLPFFFFLLFCTMFFYYHHLASVSLLFVLVPAAAAAVGAWAIWPVLDELNPSFRVITPKKILKSFLLFSLTSSHTVRNAGKAALHSDDVINPEAEVWRSLQQSLHHTATLALPQEQNVSQPLADWNQAVFSRSLPGFSFFFLKERGKENFSLELFFCRINSLRTLGGDRIKAAWKSKFFNL